MTRQNRAQPKESHKSFEDLARELECDEDEEAFKAKVKRVAMAPRPDKPEKPQP